jgi:hypothetical protein
MNTIRNSFFLSRVAVWMRAGSHPSITVASAIFQVDELAYRTCPDRHEMVARHISRVYNVKTIRVDRPMLDRIRCAIARFSECICDEPDAYIEHGQAGSEWLLQPRQDGWFAMFHGRPKDVRAFQRWLCEIMT